MRFFFLLGTAILLQGAGFDHASWDRALKRAVNEVGEVDYAALKNDRDLLAYVAALRAASPENKKELFSAKGDELAYWINAYNALTTYGVAKAYPTKGVKELGFLFGFFRRKDYVLGGRSLSLQQLENEIIRARYAEPRIHFAIVCASLSCPKLSRDAYTATNLEKQLAFQTRQYFAETRNVAVSGNTVTLAAILDWYKADFGGSRAALLEYAKQHTTEAKRKAMAAVASPRIVFRDYDWSINDLGSRARASTAVERELAAK
jgi:hypothetical protein